LIELKKIVTCGSVDDGKSTLIGRIIFETENILIDQKEKLKILSSRYGTVEKKLDLALLLDGLQDEREQGITIDVGHRYINYKNQRLVFHDSPGHNQYTKNLVTAASNCDIAILLIDITKGITDQTKIHLKILEFLNIKKIIFAINKIDLVKYEKKNFYSIKNNLENIFYKKEKIKLFFIPVSALKGDNVVLKSKKMLWYKGKSILNLIKILKNDKKKDNNSYLSIQHVHRRAKIRNYLGDLIGEFKSNKKIKILPSGNSTLIKSIYSNFKKTNKISNSSVALNLQKQFDISRGDIVCNFKNNNILIGNFFNAEVIITSSHTLVQGRQYLMRIHNKMTKATIVKIKTAFDFNFNRYIIQNELKENDFGQIEISTNDIVPFSNFEKVPCLGRFILIDEISFDVVSAGKINFALRRSGNIFKTEGKITKQARAKLKRQKPKCIWLTGLSSSGKSTIAQNLEKELNLRAKHTYILDGDNIRAGINKNLGFNNNDRAENIRRIAEISKLMVDAGLIVIVAAISPFERDRNFAKSLFEKNEFYEVYLNTPLKVCIQRDPKKIYKKAKFIKDFSKTGLSGCYEVPVRPDITIDTSKKSISNCVNEIIKKIL
jgi:bifunctional enzyme CysN/CysC